MAIMRPQAERFGAEMVDDDIVSFDLTGDITRSACRYGKAPYPPSPSCGA